jgi:uncharacterized protein
MKTALRLLAALPLLVISLLASANEEPQQLASIRLNAGMHVIQAQVAERPHEREKGLMFRKQMGANEGMLFIFDDTTKQCFWMRNTYLPLAIAFVADDGTIVNIDEMKPLTLDSHCSTKPVRFVLEMNQGWFTKRGIKAGSKLEGAPFRR